MAQLQGQALRPLDASPGQLPVCVCVCVCVCLPVDRAFSKHPMTLPQDRSQQCFHTSHPTCKGLFIPCGSRGSLQQSNSWGLPGLPLPHPAVLERQPCQPAAHHAPWCLSPATFTGGANQFSTLQGLKLTVYMAIA